MSWRSCRFIAWINPNRSLHRTMVRKFVLSASTFVSQNLTHPSWIATNGSARPGHPIIRIGDKHSKFFTSENAAINQVVTIWRDVVESVFGVVIILPLEIWQKRSLACVERVCMVLCVRGGYKSEWEYPTCLLSWAFTSHQSYHSTTTCRWVVGLRFSWLVGGS